MILILKEILNGSFLMLQIPKKTKKLNLIFSIWYIKLKKKIKSGSLFNNGLKPVVYSKK